ncbi:hypothetical protein OHB24_42145 [Kribbella sp. NBC_00482]
MSVPESTPETPTPVESSPVDELMKPLKKRAPRTMRSTWTQLRNLVRRG